jgi:hypothetical protein
VRRLALLAALLAAGATGPSAATARPSDDMMMVGNMARYPNLSAVPRADLRRGRRLWRASRAAAHRFDTVAKAQGLGYLPEQRPFRPGFTHFRKHGTRFWGRVFDPRAPQSLVFWCPTQGRCTLANFMYRAPGPMPPSTWGDLLQWHRHGTGPPATWMTHVWLVSRFREAFATCAPLAALHRDYGIRVVRHYQFTLHELTRCSRAKTI